MIDNEYLEILEFMKNVENDTLKSFKYISNIDEINPINKNVICEISYFEKDDRSVLGVYLPEYNKIRIYIKNIVYRATLISSDNSLILNNNSVSLYDIVISLSISTIIHELLHANQQLWLTYTKNDSYLERFIENPVRSLTYDYCKKYKDELEEKIEINLILDVCASNAYFIDNYEEISKYMAMNYQEYIIKRIYETFFKDEDDIDYARKIYNYISISLNSSKDIILEILINNRIISSIVLRYNNYYNITDLDNICNRLCYKTNKLTSELKLSCTNKCIITILCNLADTQDPNNLTAPILFD